jgi:MerR family transcriptional regulator/heat shock protein HspR
MSDEPATDDDKPVLPIGAVAELIGVHPRTIRQWEQHGLITPARRNGQRRFSQRDVKWLRCVRSLIHDRGYNIVGLEKLLKYAPCWDLKECPQEVRRDCDSVRDPAILCWDHRGRQCPDGGETCLKCEVYLAAMRSLGTEPPDQPKR